MAYEMVSLYFRRATFRTEDMGPQIHNLFSYLHIIVLAVSSTEDNLFSLRFPTF